MINSVTLVGRLAADPELRYTPNGTAVTSFRLAVNRKRKNQDGERDADFIPCVAWSKLAEVIAEHAKKGKEVAIEGEIRQQSWETDEGEKRSKLEVYIKQLMFLRDPKAKVDPFADDGKPMDIDDDDLPF